MLLKRDYQQPFWRGFFHAVIVTLYSIFIGALSFSLQYLYVDEIDFVTRWSAAVFIIIVSLAVCGWVIFYEPMKRITHRDLKAGTVMMISTVGWLLLFFIVFILGLIWSMG